MSERYSKVFSLPENLYAEGAPVVIAAGALLKDNQTGRVVAQLKLRNISPKTIKAATVSILPLNTVGNPLGEAIRYEYLDLSSTRDTDFGSKSAIPMPDITTRSFDAAVVEVIFADNSIWNASEAVWEALKSPEALTSRLDSEMVKQFQIEYGSGAKNFFLEQKDLWHCVCGAVNRRGEEVCHSCRKSIYDTRDIDLEALKEHGKKRLDEERKQAAQKAAAAQKIVGVAKRVLAIVLAVVVMVVASVHIWNDLIIPNGKYKDAENLLDTGEIAKAAIAFHDLGSFKDSSQRSLALWKEITDQKTIATNEVHTVGIKSDGTVVAVGRAKYNESGQCNVSDWTDIVSVAVGYAHTVGLKANGTVVAVGNNKCGQCNVSDWKDIVAITACYAQTVGLKADGSVVAVGENEYGQYDVSDWTGIAAVAVDESHTVGLKADGTVVAVGNNKYGQCNVSGWKDIVAIATCYARTVGLKADGSVVAVGENKFGQCDVSDWTDIVAVAVDESYTAGLKADGTVVVVGNNQYGQCDVSDWTDIVAIAPVDRMIVGLKGNGTVVGSGYDFHGKWNASDWTNIVGIFTYIGQTIGLKADGTVVATGFNVYGAYDNVSNWKDIRLPG